VRAFTEIFYIDKFYSIYWDFTLMTLKKLIREDFTTVRAKH